MDIKIRRYLAFSTVPVTGSYIYRDKFQLLPAPEDAPKFSASMGSHPCTIEVSYQSIVRKDTQPTSIDWVNDNIPAQNTLYENLLLMTGLSTYRIFDYSFPTIHQAWFIPLGHDNYEPENHKPLWGQEGYIFDALETRPASFSRTTANNIPLIEPNYYYNNYGTHSQQCFNLPQNITTLLDKYHLLPPKAKHAFIKACSLINQGIKIRPQHLSLAFAAFVSALETLIAYDQGDKKPDKCMECGQEKHGVIEKFKNFFNAYGNPSEEFKKYAKKIYKIRSKILHCGDLFLSDIDPLHQKSFSTLIDDGEQQRNLLITCRICMVNWLNNFDKSKETSAGSGLQPEP